MRGGVGWVGYLREVNGVPVGAGEVLSGVGFLGADRHIRRGGSGVDVGWGRLRRPRPAPVHAFPLQPGRRKRPYPAQPFPRPYGYEGASEATWQNTYP